MRNRRKIFAAILLALILSGSVFAGDMPTPPSPAPAPVDPTSPAAPIPAPGTSATPSVPDEVDTSALAFDLLCRVLSIIY